jgi:hypothetical protein
MFWIGAINEYMPEFGRQPIIVSPCRKTGIDLHAGDDVDSRVPARFLRCPDTGTELEFVIMVIAVSCVKLLSAHNSTQHTSRKHKV